MAKPDTAPASPFQDGVARKAAALLWQAARPEARPIGWGLLWLLLAAALDALGPVLGKDKTEALIKQINTLEMLDDVRKLRPLLTA